MQTTSLRFGYLSVQKPNLGPLTVNLQAGVLPGKILYNDKPLVDRSEDLIALENKIHEGQSEGQTKKQLANTVIEFVFPILSKAIKNPDLLKDLGNLIQSENAIVNLTETEFPRISFDYYSSPFGPSSYTNLDFQIKPVLPFDPNKPQVVCTQGPPPIGKSFLLKSLIAVEKLKPSEAS